MTAGTTAKVPSENARGIAAGFGAYALWGLFPIFFDALRPSGPWEILAHRILWTLLLCAIVLAVLRDWRWILPLRQQPRLLAGVTAAAVFIAINWVVYVAAVTSGHTSDAALGYFLNPLTTVALGVLVLRERLRPLQWAAVTVGVVAGAYLAFAAGTFPTTALILAFSFALYGLVKKKVGDTLPALHSLSLETAILGPAAAIILVIVAFSTAGATFGNGVTHSGLLVLSGVATAIPLLLFAAAARRIPLVTVGLIQFITPIMQLLCAVLVLDEHLPRERWIGFGIVWIALLLLATDSVLKAWSTRSSSIRG
ncbi:EamA family transporter RarD [Gordonia hydrophobica]|uniref:EamA family transporter RarD n=1 Tax=Gordonia hydrophobica TaxID=40516 RepID=A0ABZ2TVL6_9ACTN|nr:EamA family transporter RarD [Gordonia hydrophobica]MBM7366009.1 chloramphenicol-sensitive protein RarD [Gordonia hydrophobica]